MNHPTRASWCALPALVLSLFATTVRADVEYVIRKCQRRQSIHNHTAYDAGTDTEEEALPIPAGRLTRITSLDETANS
jgi:hypothetical protein